ncbi:MAG: RDD family protein [bacterium]|nr:MAG: RDD family protein [bacterium]
MGTEVGSEKASLLKRGMARVVDLLVAWALALFIPPVGIILGLVYLGVADGLQRGQSLGKMVFGLDVIKKDGHPCDLHSSLYRNLPFLFLFLFASIPVLGWILLVIVGLPLVIIETWLVIVDERGERLGDRIADTHVIEGRPGIG